MQLPLFPIGEGGTLADKTLTEKKVGGGGLVRNFSFVTGLEMTFVEKLLSGSLETF